MANKVFIEWLATAGGLGKTSKAPGTVGTLAAIPLVSLFAWGGGYVYLAAAVLLVMASIYIAHAYENLFEVEHDPKEVVIDEVAGYVVAMTWLPLTWQSFVGAFVVFRLLDGIKPFPISVMDKKIGGGLGVVADDIAAGIGTNFLLQVVYTKTSWLGEQLI